MLLLLLATYPLLRFPPVKHFKQLVHPKEFLPLSSELSHHQLPPTFLPLLLCFFYTYLGFHFYTFHSNLLFCLRVEQYHQKTQAPSLQCSCEQSSSKQAWDMVTQWLAYWPTLAGGTHTHRVSIGRHSKSLPFNAIPHTSHNIISIHYGCSQS